MGRASAPTARGTRLPEDWKPRPEVIQQMRQECPSVDLEAQHRRFTDYWAGLSGTRATKRDWNATWRNWIRRASEDTRGRPGASTADQRRAEAIERISHHQPWTPDTAQTTWGNERINSLGS